MTPPPPVRDVHPVLLRPWVAIVGGAVAGVVLAAAVIVGWSYLGPAPAGSGRARLTPGPANALWRCKAG